MTAPGNAGVDTPRGVKLLCTVRLKTPNLCQVAVVDLNLVGLRRRERRDGEK
jgi:hypothetical protein